MKSDTVKLAFAYFGCCAFTVIIVAGCAAVLLAAKWRVRP